MVVRRWRMLIIYTEDKIVDFEQYSGDIKMVVGEQSVQCDF